MKKDTHLINIYLKIHNKQNLTMDDLRYLAQYAPDCFEKTCKNVVYNFPEAKPIMEPSASELQSNPAGEVASAQSQELSGQEALFPQQATSFEQNLPLSEQQNIAQILENLKQLESHDFPITNVEANDVKSLLGNLYMELLFPHNDRDTFFNVGSNDLPPSFDWKI